jgi:23S rRNA (adenine2503-C2)-methyltransferase
MNLPPLLALDEKELTACLQGPGRARAIWGHLRAGLDPFTDESIAKGTRKRLAESCAPSRLTLEQLHVSRDDTTKMLLRLRDQRAVEAVLIPQSAGGRSRTTLCLSTQVGCARGCVFCLTATMKLVRNLSTDEIVAQAVLAMRVAKDRGLPPLRNLVLMGMGEPLDNLDAVAPALDRLTDSACGLGFGKRHVTLSTVAPSPRAVRAARNLPAHLAWSLHAADDELRRELVPTAKHTVAELRDAFYEVLRERDEPLFVEMTLIAGKNDRPEDAERAAQLFEQAPIPVRFNLLPMNTIGDPVLVASRRADMFDQVLRAAGYFTMIRRARGEDDGAACGQLAIKLPRGLSSAMTDARTAG